MPNEGSVRVSPKSKFAVGNALQSLSDKLSSTLSNKGNGIFMSSHEILGIITEEYDEFKDGVRKNESQERLEAELLDIAVGCIWGIVSLRTQTDKL